MSDRRPFGSSNWMLVVAAVMLVPMALWLAGVIDDGESPAPVATSGPTDAPEPPTAPTPSPPPPTQLPESAVERSDPDASIDEDAPPEVAAALARAEAGDVPTLGAIWAEGVVHLVGAVPGRAEADALVSVAEILAGDGDVVDAMVLDERAGTPDALGVRVDDAIAWAPDDGALPESLVPVAEAVSRVLADGAARRVTIVGHLEAGGDQIRVLAASLRRAQTFGGAVVDGGAPRDAVRTIGRGDSRPLADSDNAPERNRRIDLVFTL